MRVSGIQVPDSAARQPMAFGPLQGEHRRTGGEHTFVCVSCAWGSCAYGSKIGQWPTEKALPEGECRE